MAKLGGKKKGGIVKLRDVAEKLQKKLLLGTKSNHHYEEEGAGGGSEASCVPEDVKEGHFAVIAGDGTEEAKRFVVPLSCLRHPTFLRLLEEAAGEYGLYGFDREGALTIPCRPSELQRIITEGHTESHTLSCNSGKKPMVQSSELMIM